MIPCYRFYIIAILVIFPFVSALAISGSAKSLCSISISGTTFTGVASGEACRYVVKYGDVPARWAKSSLVSTIPKEILTTLPPSCPQPSSSFVAGSSQSEDCLYATLYVPQVSAPRTGWPVFVWIHGGSFNEGSASAPGLHGSNLASNGKMIVVVLQYRLGVLGFLPPSLAPTSADPNLGLQDIILGLKAIQIGIRVVDGDKTKVSVGGQSSGAGMIRAMWGTPSAMGLFRAAILQSDPMSYGFSTPTITNQLRDAMYSSSQLRTCITLSCLQTISISQILAAQSSLVLNAPFQIIGVPLAEPIRPTINTDTLPSDPTAQLWNSPSSLAILPRSLPILLTTVKNEGGSTIQSLFPDRTPLSNNTYSSYLSLLFGQDRATKILSSGYYSLPSTTTATDADYGRTGDNFREVFERLATDAAWRCATRDTARRWAGAGGKVWVGEWRQGVTYPDNAINGGYCSAAGRVCHEDDIFPTFGTAPSPSSNTISFEKSILARWSAFITDLDPEPIASRCPSSTRSSWQRYTATSTEDEILSLGGDGMITACPPGSFWGGDVQYDWQYFG